MTQETLLEKYWRPFVYLIATCVIFLIVFIIFFQKKKLCKTSKSSTKSNDKFDMKKECEKLLEIQAEYLKKSN